MADSIPLISFGIIVLNGEPFTRYCICALSLCLRNYYSRRGLCGSRKFATTDGHSRDGTLEIIKEIKKHEDPEE